MINSAKSLAGIVMEPGFEMSAGIDSTIATSRFVDEIVRVDSSVRSRILFKIGSPAFGVAMRDAILRAFDNLSWAICNFILGAPYYLII